MNATEVKKSNSLIYTESKIVNKKHIFVKIRLNDECKNGHQDFSATGNIYEANKPKSDKYFISGGCIHEEIIKHFPHLKIFVDLHLCDFNGAPMYPSANGFYHLTKGFNKTKPDSPQFMAEYCEYYRITPKQFNELKEAKNKVQFSIKLESLGILEQWKQQAQRAIKYLEELTGTQFLNDSKKGQHIPPTAEEIEEEENRQKNGYYTPEAEQQRELKRINKEQDKLKAELKKELNKHKLEFKVKSHVLKICGSKALENCIFYNHSKTLAFNWRNYNNIPKETVYKWIKDLKTVLPIEITFKNEKETI